MLILDRRRCRAPASGEFRARLNASQLASLDRLEREGWRLRFVRGGAPQLPLGVLVARDHSYALLQPDGRLDTANPPQVRD